MWSNEKAVNSQPMYVRVEFEICLKVSYPPVIVVTISLNFGSNAKKSLLFLFNQLNNNKL